MSFADIVRLAPETTLRILLIDAAGEHSIALAGLAQPLRLAARLLGAQRLQIELMAASRLLQSLQQAPEQWPSANMVLLVADDDPAAMTAAESRSLIGYCQKAACYGAVGAAVLWLARAGAMTGVRTALPWALYPEVDEVADRAILTPNLFEIDGNRLTCCGGAASIDFALTLIELMYGAGLQAQLKEALCIDRVRGMEERQRVALQARFGVLQPKLSEAVMLMEANIEEPLATDDIANLVGISRRQLERLFKQYLGSVPSRYYLELRLQRARQMLNESSHSIVQIGLMCGFSSGSHFSTAFGALFGITPREQRQRKLQPQSRS